MEGGDEVAQGGVLTLQISELGRANPRSRMDARLVQSVRAYLWQLGTLSQQKRGTNLPNTHRYKWGPLHWCNCFKHSSCLELSKLLQIQLLSGTQQITSNTALVWNPAKSMPYYFKHSPCLKLWKINALTIICSHLKIF